MNSIYRRAAVTAAAFALVPALVAAKPASVGKAQITVDADVSVWDSSVAPDPLNGIFPIGGGGQLNGGFVVAERGDVQIGLRITDRTDGILHPTGKKNGFYTASTGYDTGTTNRAEWNYDWHVDLRGSGTTLADYDVYLQTDIANPLFGDKGNLDLKFPAFFDDALDGAVLYQSSQNPVFGNDTFDPFAVGTYNFRLTLKPKAGGPPLTVKVKVAVTD